jgi:transcriptional regulator with XRE-family HTH domain
MDIDIGKAINFGLKRKGMSQAELARKINVSRQQVTKWISNKTMPTTDKMLEIIMILEIEDDLFPKLTKKKIESTGLVYTEESVLKRLDRLEGKYSLIDKDSAEIINELSRDEIKSIIELIKEFGKETIISTAKILASVKKKHATD